MSILRTPGISALLLSSRQRPAVSCFSVSTSALRQSGVSRRGAGDFFVPRCRLTTLKRLRTLGHLSTCNGSHRPSFLEDHEMDTQGPEHHAVTFGRPHSTNLENGRDFVLATILTVAGSSPRHVGTRFLILQDGGIVGTIGGGLFEASVQQFASTALAERKSHRAVFSIHRRGHHVHTDDLWWPDSSAL